MATVLADEERHWLAGGPFLFLFFVHTVFACSVFPGIWKFL